MKNLLIILLLLPAPALAKNVNFTQEDKSATILISAEVTSFQVITDDGDCFVSGEAIDCAEIDGFIEPEIIEPTTIEKKDSPNGNFQ